MKYEFIFFMIESVAPQPPMMVLISPSSTETPTAGTAYTLTCVGLKSASGFSQSPQIVWSNSNGDSLTSGGSITLGNPISNSLRTSQTLTFNTLSTAEAGIYSCAATLSSAALDSRFQANQTQTVSVIGKECQLN